MVEPLTPAAARTLISEILVSGTVVYSSHARQRMVQRKVSAAAVESCLRHGYVAQGEFENGSWRYAVRASALRVLVSFDGETILIIVTVLT